MSDKIDQHDIVSRLKDIAIEMGETPSRDVFCKRSGISKDRIEKFFGGYTILVQSAGLDQHRAKRKIDNSIFEKDIHLHLEQYVPKNIPSPSLKIEPFPRCIFIPDFHAPWGDMKVIEAACRYAEKIKAEYIIQLGDLYDFISHSRFPTSKNIYTPKEEQKAGRKQVEDMWRMLSSACPSSKRYQLWGNHDSRPLKRILEQYPEASEWIERMITELMSFDGVTTLSGEREELILPGNVMVLHGYLSRPGSHRDYNIGFNVVHGHLHSAHVMYKQIQGKILWEMNCGVAADINSKAFSYTPQKSLHWSKGFGALDENGPRFIPIP